MRPTYEPRKHYYNGDLRSGGPRVNGIKSFAAEVELAEDGPKHPLKWMTIMEAANYLRVCRDTVDRRLVDFDDGPREGKLRSKRFPMARGPRIWGEDVYAMLPYEAP